MKKNLFFAAAALAFAACSNEEILVDKGQVTDAEVEIGFDTYAPTMTRAENSDVTTTTALNGHHENFKVWGSKSAAGKYSEVYGKASTSVGVVTYSSSAWSASPKRFWDKSASNYYFFAVAPSKDKQSTPADLSWEFTWKTETEGSEDYSDGKVTLSDYTLVGNNVSSATPTTTAATTFKGTAADLDLMLASPCTVARTSYNVATPEKVTLQFNHILSRLNILVKKGSAVADCKVSLTELKVYNMKNKGSFDESKASGTTLSGGTVARWAATDASSAVTSPVVSGTYVPTAQTLASTATDNGVTTTAKYVLETLIIPQNITYQAIDLNGKNAVGGLTNLSASDQAYLCIKYTIDGEPYEGYYNLAAAFGMDGTSSKTSVAFNEGWQNNLTVIINPAAIEFDAVVFDWKTGTEKDLYVPGN